MIITFLRKESIRAILDYVILIIGAYNLLFFVLGIIKNTPES